MDRIAPSQTAISAFPSRRQVGSPRHPVVACDTCFAEPPLEATMNICETGSGFRKRSRRAGGAHANPPGRRDRSRKRNRLAFRRPCEAQRRARDLRLRPAIPLPHADVRLPAAIGNPRDSFSVGRPSRRPVVPRSLGVPPPLPAVGRGQPKIRPITFCLDINDPTSVRPDARIARGSPLPEIVRRKRPARRCGRENHANEQPESSHRFSLLRCCKAA